ncbi:MAG TPA: hypothetical protein VFI45_08105 [Candidatus Acidoferrum sp.]|nr:hypothetical protein [Candidatus Acidoferrum sp.]
MLRNRKFQLFASLSLFFFPISISATPDQPLWSKNAVSFPVACYSDSRPARQKICKPFKIISPDGNSYVQVEYKRNPKNEDSLVALSVVSAGKVLGAVGTPGFVEDEVLWSPDSKAFAISGSSNANTDYHLLVYLLNSSGLTRVNPARSALRDMVRSFPPCRALNATDECHDVVKHPSDWIGVAAIDWVNGSSSIVVMAEMNESSIVGGILGQVLGYEIEIPTGKILRRMEAKEFAQRWQSSMAWKFNIPDPPEYAGN